MLKESSAERTLRESLKIIKDETGNVKIICKARTIADSSAVKTEATGGRLPPRQKEGNTTPYPTPDSDLEPSVKTGMESG